MSMEVLQNKTQIADARKVLLDKKVSLISPRATKILRRLGILGGLNVGDMVKSWDVLATLNFIQERIKKDEPILDIGCYASEVIVALHKLGYINLTGVDLNPNLNQMPFQDSIHYHVVDFMRTQFDDSSFQAITSISVIEHGFNGRALLKEMSRLLKTGGYFISSFDYWPEKIDTSGVKIFDLDWRIFSKQDIAEFLREAANFKLIPVGDLQVDANERAIEFGGYHYTFAWLVLKKTN